MDYQKINLASLNGGALVELFDEELKKVLENIVDPNTKAEEPREIVLKIRIVPSKDRSSAATVIKASSKLATFLPHESFILLSTDGREVSAYGTSLTQSELPFDGGEKIIDLQGAK